MVSIITINYNSLHYTLALLNSIQKVYGDEHELIVVDNGSQSNPEKEILSEFPNVKFIRSEKNLGFAGGNNLGMQHATRNYLFFVNNDTEFRQDIITSMVSTLRSKPSIGILCPMIHYFDLPSKTQYAGFTKINPLTGRNELLTSAYAGEGLKDTAYAHGAAMMVSRNVVEQCGAMSENYFLYYEEIDWSERIRRNGYSIAVDTTSILYHKESATVGKESELKRYLCTRNRILFLRKYNSITAMLLFWFYFLLIAVPVKIISFASNRNLHYAKALFAAIAWNFSNPISSSVIGYKFNHLNHA